MESDTITTYETKPNNLPNLLEAQYLLIRIEKSQRNGSEGLYNNNNPC